MFPKEVKGYFLAHTPFFLSARNCILRKVFLWFCLLTLFIQCQHSWEMCVDHKFSQDLMSISQVSIFPWREWQPHPKSALPTTQHFQDVYVIVSKGRMKWLKLQVTLAEENTFTVIMAYVWCHWQELNYVSLKECLMALFLKTWSWCGTSGISITFKGGIVRHIDYSVTPELETQEVEPSTLFNRLSEWFWYSGQLDIYFTTTPSHQLCSMGMPGKMALKPAVLITRYSR